MRVSVHGHLTTSLRPPSRPTNPERMHSVRPVLLQITHQPSCSILCCPGLALTAMQLDMADAGCNDTCAHDHNVVFRGDFIHVCRYSEGKRWDQME